MSTNIIPHNNNNVFFLHLDDYGLQIMKIKHPVFQNNRILWKVLQFPNKYRYSTHTVLRGTQITVMGRLLTVAYTVRRPQRGIAERSGHSQSAVSKHIRRKSSGREKCGSKRCRRITTVLRGLSSNSRTLWSFTRSALRLEPLHQEPAHTNMSFI